MSMTMTAMMTDMIEYDEVTDDDGGGIEADADADADADDDHDGGR